MQRNVVSGVRDHEGDEDLYLYGTCFFETVNTTHKLVFKCLLFLFWLLFL
jgi:hypothetical protein